MSCFGSSSFAEIQLFKRYKQFWPKFKHHDYTPENQDKLYWLNWILKLSRECCPIPRSSKKSNIPDMFTINSSKLPLPSYGDFPLKRYNCETWSLAPSKIYVSSIYTIKSNLTPNILEMITEKSSKQ